jgi:hypothetical protein
LVAELVDGRHDLALGRRQAGERRMGGALQARVRLLRLEGVVHRRAPARQQRGARTGKAEKKEASLGHPEADLCLQNV